MLSLSRVNAICNINFIASLGGPINRYIPISAINVLSPLLSGCLLCTSLANQKSKKLLRVQGCEYLCVLTL